MTGTVNSPKNAGTNNMMPKLQNTQNKNNERTAATTPSGAGQKPGAAQQQPVLSKGAKERADAAKAYIEGKYSKLRNEELERKEGKSKSFIILLAWDMLETKMENLKLTDTEKELIKQDILHKEAELNRRQ